MNVGQHVPVVEIDQLSVETARRKGKQGIEKYESRLGQIDRDVAIDLPLLFEAHGAGAVRGTHHITEAIGLDDIAELGVDDQPTDDQPRVEHELLHGPAVRHEELLQPVIDPLFPDVGLVVNQGVVHVVADGADRPQVERAVRVDLAARRHPFETECRFHHRGECSSRSGSVRSRSRSRARARATNEAFQRSNRASGSEGVRPSGQKKASPRTGLEGGDCPVRPIS